MAWLGVHPDATEKVRIPADGGPEFVVGFWPALPEIAIRAKMPILSKPDVDPAVDPEKFIAQSGLSWELCRDAVKWGVRGWTEEGGIAPKMETATLDGRTHQVLSDESIDVLRRGELLIPVALRVIVFNVLTEEKKRAYAKSSGSGSKSLDTPAQDAKQTSLPPLTDPSHGETQTGSGAKGAPQT